MKTKVQLALLTLKMNINTHLLAFVICLLIFNQVVTLDEMLIVPVNAALFSCFAFYEIESTDFSAGVIKILGSIEYAELTTRIVKNMIFFLMNLILGMLQSILLRDFKSIIFSILTYCSCLSLWYFGSLVLRNIIAVFAIGIIYTFIWMVYYDRYLIAYINPFYPTFGNLTVNKLCELGVIIFGLLIGVIALQRNRFLRNFSI